MPLKIKCPSCKHVLSVPVQRVGKTVRCPICETKLRVPKSQPPQGKKPSRKAGAGPDKQPKPTTQGKRRSSTLQQSRSDPSRKRSAEAKPKRPNLPAPKPNVAAKRNPPKRPAETNEVAETKKPQEPPPATPKPPPLPKSRRTSGLAPDKAIPGESPKALAASREQKCDPNQKGAHKSPEPGDGPAEGRAQEQDNKKSAAEKRRSPLEPAHPPPLRRARATKDHPSAELTRPSGSERQDESMMADRRDAPSTLPESPTEEDNNVRGFEHDSRKRWMVYQFGVALILAALFGAVPAVMDIVDHFRTVDSSGVSRWAHVLLLVSGVQLAYAVYLMQLPDWSTVRVVSVLTLVLATVYAMLLGITILASEKSQIIQFLELGDKLYGNKAAGWCVILLGISILLAYFGGRISMRWRQAYELLTESTATE